MIIWITKYALTSGIEKVDAEVSTFPDMAVYKNGRYGMTSYVHKEGRDFCLTEKAAIKRAECMRKNKIESLRKSLDRVINKDIRIRDFTKE